MLPVGSYPDSQSPWGLLDTSGSRFEILDDEREYDRRFASTPTGPLDESSAFRYDSIGYIGTETPY